MYNLYLSYWIHLNLNILDGEDLNWYYNTLLTYILTDSPLEEQNFFLTNSTSGDDDAAFKERLKNMGKGMNI